MSERYDPVPTITANPRPKASAMRRLLGCVLLLTMPAALFLLLTWRPGGLVAGWYEQAGSLFLACILHTKIALKFGLRLD